MKAVALDKVNEILEKWSDELIGKVRDIEGEPVDLETAVNILDNMQNDINTLRVYNIIVKERA